MYMRGAAWFYVMSHRSVSAGQACVKTLHHSSTMWWSSEPPSHGYTGGVTSKHLRDETTGCTGICAHSELESCSIWLTADDWLTMINNCTSIKEFLPSAVFQTHTNRANGWLWQTDGKKKQPSYPHSIALIFLSHNGTHTHMDNLSCCAWGHRRHDRPSELPRPQPALENCSTERRVGGEGPLTTHTPVAVCFPMSVSHRLRRFRQHQFVSARLAPGSRQV